jgi:hypothetical protein
MQPSTQPSSNPTGYSEVWKILIDYLNDDIDINVQNCVLIESQWVSQSPTSRCNLPSAMAFCLQRLPWKAVRPEVQITRCEIHFPPFMNADVRNLIPYAKYAHTKDAKLNIVIDGHGSTITGGGVNSLMSTIDGSDFPLTSSKLTLRNIIFKASQGSQKGMHILIHIIIIHDDINIYLYVYNVYMYIIF